MNKKPMIIVGAIFGLIIIALIVYLILTLTTDIFKPTSEVFQRYLKQGIQNIDGILDLSKEKEYYNTISTSNYRDNTNINIKYINNQGNDEVFNINSEGINNHSEKKSYRLFNIKYNQNYDVLKTEYLQDNNTYGILFSDVAKKYISANIDEFDNFLNTIGFNMQDVNKEDLYEFIDFTINRREDIGKAIFDYINKLNNNKFGKKKSVSITMNNNEEKITQSYYLNLSSVNTKELILEVLKKLDQQEEINKINTEKIDFPELDIIIYVLKNNILRISIEQENNQIRIDFDENEINVKYTNITDNDIRTINLDMKKEEEGKSIVYDDSFNNKVSAKYSFNEENNNKIANIKLNVSNDYIKGIEMELNQNLETSNTIIEGIQKSFESEPNINITNLNANDRNSALNSLIKRIDALLINKNNQLNSEVINIWINANKKLETKYQGIKEKQIYDFNDQFLPYGGQNVEKQIIYNLLDLSGRNMEKYEKTGEDLYRVYLSQGQKNEKMADEIKQIIEKADKKFNVNFEYDKEGKISTVVIQGYKEQ